MKSRSARVKVQCKVGGNLSSAQIVWPIECAEKFLAREKVRVEVQKSQVESLVENKVVVISKFIDF